MSNQDQPQAGSLFQNMDEQEAAYAPQQLPGAGDIFREESDQDDTATAAGAVAVTNASLVGNPGGVTTEIGPGISGIAAVAPVVPVHDEDSRDNAR